MGDILVHEFMSLDGVIEDPSWTFEYGFDEQMGEAIGRVTERSQAILLGRTTYQMFEPAWSERTVEDDPGAPSSTTPPSTSSPRPSPRRPGGTRRSSGRTTPTASGS